MAYTRVNWENLPSTNTPVNATNLNKMDAGIANAVERTGDTLTGELNFNNVNDYGAIRKTRTINGTDYNVNFGLGANQSARIEFQDANQSNLGSLEVRSDGHIWNGQNNKKLGEVANLTWGSSLTFSLDVGRHALVMVGNTDCLMLWMAGNEILNTVRLLGTSVQATSSGTTVTIKYSDNRNFTGNAFIT